MASEGQWNAEDFDWDPHNLVANPTSTASQDAAQNEAAPSKSGSEEAISTAAGRGAQPGGGPQAPVVSSAEEADPGGAPRGGGRGRGGRLEGVSASDGLQEEATTSSGGMHPAGGLESEGKQSSVEGEVTPVVKESLTAAQGPAKRKVPMLCQIDGCKKDLSKEKDYYQRYRICEDHLKMGRLIKDGIPQRFCQQCGRFHLLADFDANKRSCRARLSLHNDRRRKRVPEQMTPRADLLNAEPRTRRTRTRRKRVPYGEEATSEELEAAESEGTSGARGAGRKAASRGSSDELSGDAGRRRRREARGASEPQPSGRHHLSTATYPHEEPLSAEPLPYQGTQEAAGTPQRQHRSQRSGGGTEAYSQLQPSFSADPYYGREHPRHSHAHQEAELPFLGGSFGRLEDWHHYSLEQAPSSRRDPGSGARYPQQEAQQYYGHGGPSTSLSFRPSPPEHDYYIEQQSLLRGASWASREGDPAYPGSGAVPSYSLHPLDSTLRHSSEMPSLHHTPLKIEHRLSGDAALLGRFSDRGNTLPQLKSGESDSSGTLFHSPSAQQSAASMPGLFAGEGSRRQRAGWHDMTPSGGRRATPPPSQLRVEPLNAGSPMLSGPWPKLEYPGQAPGRYSDPGVNFAQQYQGLHGEGRRINEQYAQSKPARYSEPGGWSQHYGAFSDHGINYRERLHMSRSSIKTDVPPQMLPSRMREDFMRIASSADASSPAAHLEASLRPGCTHVVATSLAEGTPLNALEAAAKLIAAGSRLWAGAEVLVQAPGSAAQVQGGRVTGFWSGANHAALQPARPTTDAAVVLPGGEVAVACAPERRSQPVRLLASCNGAFLVDQEVSGREVSIQLPESSREGVLWLESECAGILSGATPLVLTGDPDVAEEVAGVGALEARLGMPEPEVRGLLVDIGMCLQKASHLGPALESPDVPAPGCCRVVPPPDDGPSVPMVDPAFLKYIAEAAARVLALCCREGWPALAAKVLPVAALGLEGWQEVVEKAEDYLGEDLLLHAAVTSGSLSMVTLLLDLHDHFKEECCLVGELGGETALHVAAAIPDGGRMSKLVQDRCPLARGMWNSRRNAQGRAPADIAYLANKKELESEDDKGGSIAKLIMETRALNSPPSTPRLGDGQATRKPAPAPAAEPGNWVTLDPTQTERSRRGPGSADRSGRSPGGPGGSRLGPMQRKITDFGGRESVAKHHGNSSGLAASRPCQPPPPTEADQEMGEPIAAFPPVAHVSPVSRRTDKGRSKKLATWPPSPESGRKPTPHEQNEGCSPMLIDQEAGAGAGGGSLASPAARSQSAGEGF